MYCPVALYYVLSGCTMYCPVVLYSVCVNSFVLKFINDQLLYLKKFYLRTCFLRCGFSLLNILDYLNQTTNIDVTHRELLSLALSMSNAVTIHLYYTFRIYIGIIL